MKRTFVYTVCLMLFLLFVYTATSKFLDFDKFVFQMRLAPVYFMSTAAPFIGWIIPTIEIVIAITLAAGLLYPRLLQIALYGSVTLLAIFEFYIAAMLLSGSHLPCTCGGIISSIGWTEHLFFNAFFIIIGAVSINILRKHDDDFLKSKGVERRKILSRA
jgi:hypothetical protein